MRFTPVSENHPFVVEALRKRGRNEACWCGSNIKYKKCHLNKEKLRSPEFKEALNQNHPYFQIKKCLHPDQESCTGARIRAHTIQRNGSLKSITDDTSHVLTFKGFGYGSVAGEPLEVGWKKASTFYGFCSFHDSETFKPIEVETFSATKEQFFLFYYRSLCYELYNKEALILILKHQKTFLDSGLDIDSQIEFQLSINKNIEGFGKSLEELKAEKNIADNDFLQSNHEDYHNITIYFEGNSPLLTSGFIHTDRTVKNNKLFDMYNLNITGDTASMSLLNLEENKSAFIFTWHKRHTHALQFAKELYDLKDQEFESAITQLIFAETENSYFEKSWWENMNKAQRKLIYQLAFSLGSECYEDFDFSLKFTDLKFTDKSKSF